MDSQIGGKRKEKKIKKSTGVKGVPTVVGLEPNWGSIDCHGMLLFAGLVTIVCRAGHAGFPYPKTSCGGPKSPIL